MPESTEVTPVDFLTDRLWNALRKDVLDPTLGHPHDGSAEGGKKIDIGDLTGANLQSFINLLENADFEIGDPPTGWTTVGPAILSRVSTPVKIGSFALKVTSGTTLSRAGQSIPDYARYAGRNVTLGVWVQTPATNTYNSSILLWDGVAAREVTAPKDGAWHWVTVTLPVDASPTTLSVELRPCGGNAADGEFAYFDGAMLVEGKICPAFSPKPVFVAATLTVAETEVFNGVAPTTWTDLDLSGTIGAQASLVLLKFTFTVSVTTPTVAFRKNGDIDEFYYTGASSYASGVALICGMDELHMAVLVATDASGIIEWKASEASSCTIDIIAYIK